MNFDVAVIGAGLSGLVAAAAAAEQKKRVLVVGRGMGIITIFTGTIDVLGYWPIESDTPLVSALEGIARLVKKEPDHPYAKVGIDGVRESIRFFTETARRGGVEYVGDGTENILIPTAVGTVKPTAVVSSSMAEGDLRVNKDVLIFGFEGLKDFYPAYMAHNISTLAVGGLEIPRFRWRLLTVGTGARRSGLNCLTLAGRLEDHRVLKRITDEVYPHVRKGERVAFPAVLGVRTSREIHKAMEQTLGVPVFETPTLPPSVPGYRLYKALERALRELGVHMLIGYEVLSPMTFGRRIGEITVAMGKREKRVSANAFVLATGGLVGKGITSSYAGFSEPIFDLPVRGPKKRSDWFRTSLFDAAGHPVNRTGVEVDDSLRPLGRKGAPVFENLFVCGTQLYGFDALREKSGGGVAVSSGYKAGIEAARFGT
jgi:glycerol-3-phosphate dehydrogenase subunit B